MSEFKAKNYSWRVYGDGGPYNPSCELVGYFTEESQKPTQWQEVLHGDAEKVGLAIINHDRSVDEPKGDFKQSIIDEESRWYARKSNRTGNSWEVVLDEAGNPKPDPCKTSSERTDPDPVHLTDAIITLVRSGNNVTVTISGTEAD